MAEVESSFKSLAATSVNFATNAPSRP